MAVAVEQRRQAVPWLAAAHTPSFTSHRSLQEQQASDRHKPVHTSTITLMQSTLNQEIVLPHASLLRLGLCQLSQCNARETPRRNSTMAGSSLELSLEKLVTMQRNAATGDEAAAKIWQKCVQTQTIRDVELNAEALASMWDMVTKAPASQRGGLIHAANELSQFPEFDRVLASACVGAQVVPSVARSMVAGDPRTASAARRMLEWLYSSGASHRVRIRVALGDILRGFALSPSPSCHGVFHALQLLRLVVQGMPAGAATTGEVLGHLVSDLLLPLHAPNVMVGEVTPVLGQYHKDLLLCMLACGKVAPPTLRLALQGMRDIWPAASDGQSPKEVLLMHGVSGLIQGAERAGHGEQVDAALPALLPLIAAGIRSEYSRLTQGTLGLFKDKMVLQALRRNATAVIRALAAPILRGGKRHWNDTVNSMRHSAIQHMLEWDRPTFMAAALEIGGGRMAAAPQAAGAAGPQRPPKPVPRPADSPAAALAAVAAGGQPPVTVTGVAPWSSAGKPGGKDLTKYMAVAPTAGVAASPLGGLAAAQDSMPPPPRRRPAGAVPDEASIQDMIDNLQPTTGGGALPGLERLAAAAADTTAGKESAQAASDPEHMSAKPVALTTLRFHDLVFGKELGRGAFSVVKYAKVIRSGFPTAQWPEYAVKTIDTDVLKTHDYELPVRREIAVLGHMQHPCITRLVASFRSGGNAYLVTEYASKGDLHTHITHTGSMSTESARFVLGEIVAALAAVHAAGFAFGDLKPENIVLTGSGHGKLTDFGAVRPLPGDAGGPAASILATIPSVVESLRDGHWAAELDLAGATPGDSSAAAVDSAAQAEPTAAAEDTRVEATAAYMAPELVAGGSISKATDAWALGCTLFFALAGKPPVWAEGEAEIMSAIVKWDPAALGEAFPPGFPPQAADLVMALLQRDPAKRLGARGFEEIAQHPFFEPLHDLVQGRVGMGCLNGLWQASPPELAEGMAAPVANAKWSQRQFSRMFSPALADYSAEDVPQEAGANPCIVPGREFGAVIAEGAEEAGVLFSSAGKPAAVPRTATVQAMPAIGE